MNRNNLEIPAVVFCILAILFFNLFPHYSRTLNAPKDRFFTGAQQYSDDYGVYVSYIKQGQVGRWAAIDKYTSEPHSPSLVHWEYLLWGKLTGIFGVSAVGSYHLGRIVFGLLLLLSVYFFLFRFFPGDAFLRVASFALICFGVGFLRDGHLPIEWLTETDPVMRFTTLPHYLIGFVLMVWIFDLFLKNGKSNPMLVGLLGALISFVLPSGWIIVLTALALFVVLGGLKTQQKLLIAIFIGGLVPFVYYRYVFGIVPWSHIPALERQNAGPFTFWQYALSFGAVFFLAFLGVLERRDKAVLLLLCWVVATFSWAFLLAGIFGISSTRFLQIPLYVPLTILSVIGLWRLIKKRLFLYGAFGTILILNLIVVWKLFVYQMGMYRDFPLLLYPPKSFEDAFSYLSQNTAPGEVLLSYYHAGNLAPFLAGNTVYAGHLQETIDYGVKASLSERFYQGIMPAQEAYQFLVGGRINLVFLGYQERSMNRTGRDFLADYRFLVPVYQEEGTIIYRFKND